MKYSIPFFVIHIILSCNIVNAQLPNWLWAKNAGGINDDYSNSVATDTSGNIFITGVFNDATITFGTTTLTNAGGSDIFIAKYDAGGNVLWARSAGNSSADAGFSVSTDVDGNVFVTGEFDGATITFGTTTLTNAGFANIFIVKYDANGNVLWAKSAGGNLGDYSFSVVTDASGNVYVAGEFTSPTITFGSTTLVNSGGGNIFIVKYDSNGNVLWAKSAGGSNYDLGRSVSTDANGNVFMTGYFSSDTISFETDTFKNVGASTIFIVKYDTSGNLLWAKYAGGSAGDVGSSATTDISGNVYITGWFDSPTITFGTTILTNAGYNDIFIVKYDASGNVIWARQAGSIDNDVGYSISSDASGFVFLAGSFSSPTLLFGVNALTNAGQADIFVAKYDASGNVINAKSAGGNSGDYGTGVSSNSNGKIIVTGEFASTTINFGTTTLINAGNYDIFIATLDTAMTIGIGELIDNSTLIIAPNPFTSQSTITFDKEQKNTTVKIVDVLGNEIKTTTFSGKQFVIEKGAMKPGIYFVQAIDEKKNVANKKIVIQ